MINPNTTAPVTASVTDSTQPRPGAVDLNRRSIKQRSVQSRERTDEVIIEQAKRRPWVSARTLAKLVRMSTSTIQKYNSLPGCPMIKIGNRVRYDVDEYREWLRDGGPAKGRARLARQLLEAHK